MSGDPISREDFQSLYLQVQSLTDTVEELEKENRDLKNDFEDVSVARDELEHALRELTTLQDNLESVTRTVSSLERRVRALDEDTDDIEENLSELEQELYDGRYSVEQKISKANKRITGIEAHLDIGEIEMGRAIRGDASELEHLAALPEDVRESKLDSKPLLRAVEIYENFESWSDYTPRGHIIDSSDLRKYMSGDLAWSQVYRAMKEFGKNTSEEYAYIDNHPKHGKILIRPH